MDINVERVIKVSGKNIIVFDGECVLCSRWFKFVLKHDKQQQFSFAIAQSNLGEALYAYYGLKADDYDTNLVFIDGKLFKRMSAFFVVMKALGYPYRLITIFSCLPNIILDWAYYKIARNRYSLFGKRDTCFMPDAAIKARFIDG